MEDDREGELAQGGEEESTVLEIVIKKTQTHTKPIKQKIPQNKRVLQHLNTLNSGRQLYSINHLMSEAVETLIYIYITHNLKNGNKNLQGQILKTGTGKLRNRLQVSYWPDTVYLSGCSMTYKQKYHNTIN